jgi:tetratricopeptide (TPR) repeat protein
LTHDEINALRELAARYLREGRPALAEARLTDALHGAPGDQDVLVDLGTVLFQTQHYDDAGQQFQAALDAHPDNLAATQGLALVANAQRRYPEARQHLQHLLKRTPESGLTWLRYGDVEHRLGELDTALQAWRRVLEVEPAESQVRRMAEERLRTFGRAPARAP